MLESKLLKRNRKNKVGVVNLDKSVPMLQPDLFKSANNDLRIKILNST